MSLPCLFRRSSPSISRFFRCIDARIQHRTACLVKRNFANQAQESATGYDAAKANYEARCDLAACYRILHNLGFSEGVCNHLSLSCPAKDGSGRVMLTIPFGLYWAEVTASSLVGMSIKDPNNPVVHEEGFGNPDISAVSIHTGIHHAKAEAGINCVLHSHVPYASALTCIEGQKLEMVHQNSTRFLGEVCYDNAYDGMALCLDEGARLANILDDKTVMMMGNHGVLVIGRTVSEAFDQMYYLERAAKVQVLAMSTGKKLSIISDKLADVNKQFHRETFRHYADMHFNAMKRMIENEKPHYKS